MSVRIIEHLKSQAERFAFGSSLYEWSLRGEVVDRLLVKPVDVWPGDPEAGRRLCEGAFKLGEEEFSVQGCGWDIDGASDVWLRHMHGFGWLRDLPAFAYQSGQQRAVQRYTRTMIMAWIDRYWSWDAVAWRADIVGQRIAKWISYFEFFNPDSLTSEEDFEFHEMFFDSLMRQSKHLSRVLKSNKPHDDLYGGAVFRAAKGLLYAGLAMEDREVWVQQALDVIKDEIDAQILGDGCHISRNPYELLRVLQVLLDIRGALRSGGRSIPDHIQHAIDRMGQALRFFRYSDKGLAVFNGTQEGDVTRIDAVLAQAGARGKSPNSLPCGGYERVILGRTHLMFDCGRPPKSPYNHDVHASPLAFEMCYGRERLFVNCGTHLHDDMWRDALRATAAHNALCIDNRNAYEINKNSSLSKKLRYNNAVREDIKHACLLDAEHDGYEALNGYTHRRRIYLSKDGDELIGEDTLSASLTPHKPLDVSIRLHLHPKVNVSLIREGQEALLMMANGTGWRFRHSGGVLALEDSLYLGQGYKPRKTKQLVIYGQLIALQEKFKWGVTKEG